MAEPEDQILDGAIAPAARTVLFGHTAAAAFLAESYRSGKGHHAILIEGPEGIGKATLAFRFAHHVLAHPDPATAPDHLADPDPGSGPFRQISAGASHNLLHLTRPVDAKTGKRKSAITVDEVRRAGKFFSQTTGSQSWRIVIVDTADDLNRNAANAILKILEEPPRRSMFLVLSNAPGKLLPTIRSRCLPLVLRPLADPALLACLADLGISLPPTKQAEILSAAGGSVARVLKLVNYGGLDIMEAFDEIIAADGPSQRKAMHRLADAVAQKDGDTLYGFFLEHASAHLSQVARNAALAGDTERAFALSRQFSRMNEQVSIADGYNLDRKQTVLTLLGEIAALNVS